MVQGIGAGVWVGAVRLKAGSRIQVMHFGNGHIRYRYGDIASPPLYAVMNGISAIYLHPGTEVFIEVAQDNGPCFIHVVDDRGLE